MGRIRGPRSPGPGALLTFPAPRFPAGVAAPSLFFLVALLLVAVACVVGVRSSESRTISPAVLSSQHGVATSSALAIEKAAQTASGELSAVVAARAADIQRDPRAAAHLVVEMMPRLRSVAVVDTSHRVLGSQGEPVAADRVPLSNTVSVVVDGRYRSGPARARVVASAGPDRFVIGFVELRLPAGLVDSHLTQRVLLVEASGQVVEATGAAARGSRSQHLVLVQRATIAVQRGAAVDLVDEPALVDPHQAPQHPVGTISAAPVALAAASGSSPLVVMVVSEVPPTLGPGGWPGVALAVGLVVVAALAFVIFRGVLVRPIRRLRDDVHALAAGETRQRVRRCRIRDVDMVAAALQRWTTSCGTNVAEQRETQRPKTVSLSLVSAALGVLVLGWVVAGGITLVRPGPAVQTVVRVEDNRQRVAAATESLRHHLDDGLLQVQAAVSQQPGDTRGIDLGDRIRELMANTEMFRSAYIVDGAGVVIAEAGRAPMRSGQLIPAGSGIAQLNTTGPVPVIAAFARASDGAHAVVAEFEVASLAALLRTANAHVRVVDSGLRVVLDGQGYRAFAQITEPFLRDAAAAAVRGGGRVQMGTVNNDTLVVAALPIGDKDPAAALRWVIIGDQRVSSIAFWNDSAARAVLAVVGLTTAAVVITLMWTWLAVIRPLRRAADLATSFAAPEASDAAAAERLDEIGAIVTDLNRCWAQSRPQAPAPRNPTTNRSEASAFPIESPIEAVVTTNGHQRLARQLPATRELR